MAGETNKVDVAGGGGGPAGPTAAVAPAAARGGAVVGGGPAGLTAAVALAAAGVETALISKTPPPDNRTTALWSASVAAMEALGVWPLCREDSAPLTAIRLID